MFSSQVFLLSLPHSFPVARQSAGFSEEENHAFQQGEEALTPLGFWGRLWTGHWESTLRPSCYSIPTHLTVPNVPDGGFHESGKGFVQTKAAPTAVPAVAVRLWHYRGSMCLLFWKRPSAAVAGPEGGVIQGWRMKDRRYKLYFDPKPCCCSTEDSIERVWKFIPGLYCDTIIIDHWKQILTLYNFDSILRMTLTSSLTGFC